MRVPRWLVAELTYKCPLRCAYCSNPVNISSKGELSTKEWLKAFEQARALGSVQLGLTGGEPLMRPDLLELVRETRKMGYYTNLITSSMGLTEKRLDNLKAAGLDSVQISFQAEQRNLNDFLAGKQSYEHKMKMMRAVKERNIPLTLNVVLHRLNIDRMSEICALCESMDPDYVELASMQAHGWAKVNAGVLMPTPRQVERAQAAIATYQKRSRSSGEIFYVLPDLIERRAKNCHNGWGEMYICINPQGSVTPCLSALTIPEVKSKVQNVKTASIQDIWEGPVFKLFRGKEWMKDEGAKNSPRRHVEGNGCRCQAYALTGDARNMDPACSTSSHHDSFLEWMKDTYESEKKEIRPRTLQTA